MLEIRNVIAGYGRIDVLRDITLEVREGAIVVVGGLGSIAGSVVGALVLTALPEALRDFKEYNELVYGALVLVSLMVLPQGLVSLGPTLRARLAGRSRATRLLRKYRAGPP